MKPDCKCTLRERESGHRIDCESTPTPPPEAARHETLAINRTMKPTDPVAAPLLPKLLPCPFCGSPAEIIMGHRDHFSVQCTGCRINPFTFARDAGTGAIAAWNTRAPLPPRADWALEKAQLESQILVLQARLGQGQEEPQGQLASEAQKALASLQENPKWTQWVNAVYSEPRFNAPHRMSHVRALEMAALLFLRHAPAAPDAQDGERLLKKCVEVMSAASPA